MRPLVMAKNGLLVPSTILLDCGRQPCDTTYPEPPPPVPPQPGPDDFRRAGSLWDIATMTMSQNLTIAGQVHTLTATAVLHPSIDPSWVTRRNTLFSRGFSYLRPAGAPGEVPPGEPWVTITFHIDGTFGFDAIAGSTAGYAYAVEQEPYEWQSVGTPLSPTTFSLDGGTGISTRPTRLPAGTNVVSFYQESAITSGAAVMFGFWDLTE